MTFIIDDSIYEDHAITVFEEAIKDCVVNRESDGQIYEMTTTIDSVD